MERAKAFLGAQRQTARSRLRLTVLLGNLGGGLLIAEAWLLARIVDAVLFRAADLAAVLPYLLAMPVLFLARALVVHGAERSAFSAAAVIKQQLREQLLGKLQRLGPLYLSGQRSGEMATLLSDGIETLEGYYARYLPAMALAVWIPLAILVFVLPVDARSALVLVVTAPLIPLFMIWIGRGAERLNQQQWQQLARLGARFLDAIQGLTTLRLFNATAREARLLRQDSEDYRRATMRVLRVAFLSSLALEFFATISIAIVAVLLGFRLLFQGVDFKSAFFVLLLAPEFYLPLRALGVHYHARMEALAAAERMLEVLQEPDPPSADGGIEPPREAPGIVFEHVVYRYGDRPALEGVSLDWTPGEWLALVGPSGSGKSTLVQLLLGFMVPDEGRIRVDGTDLRRIDPAAWRRNIAWVPQKPRLFAGTVAENLALGLERVAPDAMKRALEQARALEFVEALPQGMDTPIGEAGRQLSGGQVQRLALARAFLRDARLLILDEPTAHLDRHNERALREVLEGWAEGRSLLTVAHRLSTVRRADRILVLDRGRVVQQGRHAALLEQPGLYRELVRAGEHGR